MKKGGILTIRIPTKEDIITEIQEGRPLIGSLTTLFLYPEKEHKAGFNFHFNLITGIDKNFVYVNDPAGEPLGGKYKYPINEFFYALYATAFGDIDNGAIMKISKKKND